MPLKNKMYTNTPYFLLCVLVFALTSGEPIAAQNQTIEAYIEKCKRYSRNSDSLLHYSNLLIQLKEPKAKAEGYYAKAYAYRNSMQLDSALWFFDKAATFVEENDYNYLTKIARLSSITATQAAEFDKAFQYADEMKKLATRKGDSMAYATAINQEGVIFKNKGDLNAAIEKYAVAGKIQKFNKYPQLPYTYTNIAIAYTELKQDSLSLIWFHKAYKTAQNIKDTTIITRSVNNLGNYYKLRNDVDSSLYYFKKLLENDQKLALDQRTLLYQNLADLYNRNDDYQKALYYYKKAEPAINKGQNVKRKIELLTVLFQMERKRNNSTEVLKIADSLIALIQQSNLPTKLLPVYLAKAEILKERNDYKNAVIALDKYNRIKDSLGKLQDAETIQRVVSEFELAEKEIELKAALNNRSSSVNTTAVISLLTLLLILALLYYRFMYKKSPKANQNNKAELRQIILKTKRILKCDEIIYIKSDGPYLEYFTIDSDQPIMERNTLKSALESLKNCDFVQVHRSYVVNQSKIKAVYAATILLDHDKEVPLSRSFKQKLKEEQHELFQ